MKNYLDAISDYNAALKLKPDSAKGFYNRGLSRYNTGDRKNGCDDMKKAAGLGDIDAKEFTSQQCR